MAQAGADIIMKMRDSGMPEEAYWETLLDVPLILDQLGVDGALRDVVELGCGYGTFSLPLAQRITGTLTTVDIEPEMVCRTAACAAKEGISNLRCELSDVMKHGFDGYLLKPISPQDIMPYLEKIGGH